MDQIKTGELIKNLRTQKNLTQKQLAKRLNVSDKAVSKWECGNGCPDISLLAELAHILETDIQTLILGEINKNESEKGDMKKIRFYVCPKCANIITSTSNASPSCCGSKLVPLKPKKASDDQKLNIQDLGNEWYITSDHEMTKDHYISFVAYLTDSSLMIFKQYPEWDLQVNLPKHQFGRLVWYCTRCGLLYHDITQQ